MEVGIVKVRKSSAKEERAKDWKRKRMTKEWRIKETRKCRWKEEREGKKHESEEGMKYRRDGRVVEVYTVVNHSSKGLDGKE